MTALRDYGVNDFPGPAIADSEIVVQWADHRAVVLEEDVGFEKVNVRIRLAELYYLWHQGQALAPETRVSAEPVPEAVEIRSAVGVDYSFVESEFSDLFA